MKHIIGPSLDTLIVDQLDVAVVVCDLQDTIVRWNRAAQTLYGWSASVALGKRRADLLPIVRFVNGVTHDTMDSALHEHGRWTGECIQRRSDGTEIRVSASVSYIRDEQGEITHTLMTLQHCRYQSADEQFRLLFEYSPDAIWLIDPHDPDVIWPIVDCNEAACRMTGYTREEIIGQSNDMFNPGAEFFDIGDRHIDRVREAGILRDEDVQRHKNGSLIDIEYTSRMITLDGRELLLGIDRDITERKRIEAAILDAKEDAERANRAKSEFLSRMSHELRTPLSAILGFGNMMAAEVTNREHLEYLDYILRAGDHLLALINDILDISRVETTQLVMHIQPVRVGEVVAQALQLVQAQAEEREIQLGTAPAGVEHLLVQGDPRRITQVLVNLLSNAVKYNRPRGSVAITCTTTSTSARITVADTGHGIAAHDIERLFRPFERLGADRTAIDGVGLGLALSRQLVEQMGGIIGVESTPGEGTQFWIELPLSRIEER